MKIVSKADDVYTLIQKVKTGSASFVTNLFIDPEKLNDWINNQLFFVEELTGGLLLYRKDNLFYHLYYCSGSLNILSDMLKSSLPSEKIVVDLIGKEEDIKPLAIIFDSVGFKVHTQLHRYIRINNADSNYYEPSESVGIASEPDYLTIAEMLGKEFDKYAEQIPTAAEVKKMIEEKMILVIKEQNEIKGFLIRKTSGQTTILNNFLVDPRSRGEKIGSRLLKYYIFESKNVKRMILWVLADNSTGINLYKHHNYVRDNLVDTIMIKS